MVPVLAQTAEWGQSAFRLQVEQAGLGGDLVGEVGLALTASPDAVKIERLAAKLPGENKIEASGSLISGPNGPVFSGPVKLEGQRLRTICLPEPGALALLAQAAERLALSARAHDRVLRVGRTIADLAACERVSADHVSEALQYRGII